MGRSGSSEAGWHGGAGGDSHRGFSLGQVGFGLPLCHQASRSESTGLEISDGDAFRFTPDFSVLETLPGAVSARYRARPAGDAQ